MTDRRTSLRCWQEPEEFASARNRAAGVGRWSWLTFGVLFVGCVAILSIAGGIPKGARDAAFYAAISLVMAWGMTVAKVVFHGRRSRQRIRIGPHGIHAGPERFSFDEIAFVVVGTQRLDGGDHRVLMIRTWKAFDHIFGIADDVDPEELARELAAFGLDVR